MFSEIKNNTSYKKTLILFSVITLISGLVYAFVGQIVLPFLTSFCAALFIFENPRKRVLSFLIPGAVLMFNLIINGLYAVVSVEFVISSVILAVFYTKNETKASTVAFMTVIGFIFSVAYLYFYPYEILNTLNPREIIEFYAGLIENYRVEFVKTLSSLSVQLEDGTSEVLMSHEEADIIFSGFLNLTVGFFASIAFVISGCTVKLFSRLVAVNSEDGLKSSFENFLPSTVISVFFIIISVFNVFSTGETLFEIAIANIGLVFSLAYAYIGFKFVQEFMVMINRKSMFWILFFVAFILTGATLVQLLSYLGVYFALVVSKNNPTQLNDK